MQRVTVFKTEREDENLEALLISWNHYLREHDHSAGTIKKYTQAVMHETIPGQGLAAVLIND